MKSILFVSTNDGSDMRINKEIRTLSKKYKIHFIGNGNYEKCFIAGLDNVNVHLINAKRNSLASIIKLNLLILKLIFKNRISSIHVINEQLLIFIFHYSIFYKTVLDIFDSLFLKINKPGNSWWLAKKILYSTSNKVIVTDSARFNLLPSFVQRKAIILPNYPELTDFNKKDRNSQRPLTIIYFGWLGKGRGTEIVEGLLKTTNDLKVIMAGWFSDTYTSEMIHKYGNKVEYRGVVTQQEALKWANEEADYILCVYSPINTNNLYASPNKIYDAISTYTPVIINSEIKISSFVREKNLGFIIDKYDVSDFNALYNNLQSNIQNYTWGRDLVLEYSWTSVEESLIYSHN